MRKQAAYKKFFFLGQHLKNSIPKKIFTLKRSKWKTLISKLKFSFRKDKIKFFNLKKYINKTKKWENQNFFFKQQIKARRTLGVKFNSSIKIFKLLKKNKFILKKNIKIQQILGKIIYRLDVLLFFLNITKSIYQARQKLNAGTFLVNNKKVFYNKNLKKGDVITINYSKGNNVLLNLNLLSHNFLNINKVFTFLDFDLYTNSIIVLKHQKEISFMDLSLLIKEKYEIKYW